MTQPASPLDWHPWYAEHRYLLAWLSHGELQTVYVTQERPRFPSDITDSGTILLFEPEPVTLTKQRAYGPAPYVGRPFGYEWWVGVDNFGRQIAGQSRIIYHDE